VLVYKKANSLYLGSLMAEFSFYMRPPCPLAETLFIVTEAAAGKAHLLADGVEDALQASMVDEERDFPQEGGRRGNRLRRSLDGHCRIGDTVHVGLPCEECVLASSSRRHTFGACATWLRPYRVEEEALGDATPESTISQKKNGRNIHMYATVTELACKSPVDLEHTVQKLQALYAQVQHLPGLSTLYVIKTAEQTLVMVTLSTSEAEAEQVSAQVRTHLGHVIGEHVCGPPRRASGEVLLHHSPND